MGYIENIIKKNDMPNIILSIVYHVYYCRVYLNAVFNNDF